MNNTLKQERCLQDIVPFMQLKDDWKNTVVTGLAVDSRKVQQGNCFIAYPGHVSDGREYLRAAFSAGAGSALVEADGFAANDRFQLPVIPVSQLQTQLGSIASRFYGNPSAQMTLLAVTGTNGKTSVSQLVSQALVILGEKAGVIGTLGNGLVGQLQETANTTPDVVECNRLLAEMLASGAGFVAMETSSHGLVQGRVDGLSIHSALVTNISRDHLDYHGTMEAYTEAKTLIARQPGLKNLVLNLDDERVADMRTAAASDTKVWTFSLRNIAGAAVTATSIEYQKQGMNIGVQCGGKTATIHSALIGEFNSSNLLASLTLLLCAGVELKAATAALSQVEPIAGRMQCLSHSEQQPMVVVDFAHTPDALEKALLALRQHTSGRIWCVFGCGGDRDAGKRPLMAQVVADLADEMILTADNPRSETFSAIVADMVRGVPEQRAFSIIESRAKAIVHAINNASQNDVVLVAGKGHENYQEVAGVKHPYSDVDVCRGALQSLHQTFEERGH